MAFCCVVGEGRMKICVITGVSLMLPATILALGGNIDFGINSLLSILALRGFIDIGPKETKECGSIKIRKQKKSLGPKTPETLDE